jgi:hypothetical protein
MADTTVTGRIGDMDVALINAASEATMIKLLESMNALSNKIGAGGPGGNSGGAQEKNTAAVNSNTTAFNKTGQAVGEFAGAIADATKGLLNFAGNLLGGTYSAIKKLTTELLFGGDKITDFTKHLANLPSFLGRLGSVVHTITQFFQQGVDTFRSLSQVGAGFTGSLTDMRTMAAQSGMTLDRFSKTVISNAESMALFGSSVALGAQRFGKLSKDLRSSEAGERLMNMGFSIDEINETLITYANINSRMGRDRARSDSELIQRAAEFGEELNAAAAATGLSRKAIGDAATALSKDAVIGSIKQRLGEEKGKEFEVSISAFVAKFGEVAPAALEVLAGFPKSPEAVAFASMAPEMAGTLAKLRSGQISGIEFQNAMVEAAQKRRDELLALSPSTLASRRLNAGFAQYEKSIMQLAAANVMSAEQVKEEMKRQANSKAVDAAFKQFDNLIETFRATFALKFLESDAFKEFEAVINGVLGKIPGFGNVLDALVDAFENVLRGVSQFISDWQALGFEAAFSNAMTSAQEAITKWVRQNTGKDSFYDKITTDISKAISRGIQDGAKSIWGSIKKFVDEFQTEILLGVGAFLAYQLGKKAIGGIATGVGERIGRGRGGNTAGGESFSPLQALGNSFASAAGWLMKGAAIGASMIAIGFGFGKLAEGIAPFVDIDWETGGKAIAALSAMATTAALLGAFIVPIAKGSAAIGILGLAVSQFPAGTLTELAKLVESAFTGIGRALDGIASVFIAPLKGISEIVDAFSRMQTAGTEAATASVKALSNIPAANMTAAAAGVDAIKKALEGFNPSFLTGLSEGLGSLFGKDNIGPLEKLAELGPKLGTAAPGFSAFKEATGSGFNIVGLSLNPQQTRSIEILSKEMPAYAAGLQTVSMMGPNLQGTATALKAFVEASQGVDLNKFVFTKEQSASLADGTNKLKNLAAQLSNASREFKKLDDTGLAKIKDGVEGLSKAFKDFNESFIEKFLPKFESMKSTTQEGFLTEVGSKLDTLNSTVTSLVGIERDSRGFLSTISTRSPGKIS